MVDIKEGDCLYRAFFRHSYDYIGLPKSEIQYESLKVKKLTPQGYRTACGRFIYKTGTKVYARATKEQAKNDLYYRSRRREAILKKQLNSVSSALNDHFNL